VPGTSWETPSNNLPVYELFDLVILEVGLIVRVGQEDFAVINHQGVACEVRPDDLRETKYSASGRAVALGASCNPMRCGD
jgi:hypothetical protein